MNKVLEIVALPTAFAGLAVHYAVRGEAIAAVIFIMLAVFFSGSLILHLLDRDH